MPTAEVADLHGVLVIDKPAGVTSAQVVATVKKRLRCKVGHTGTLDPMATGVLPLCVGEGTKIAGYLLAQDKAYDGELELGARTDTLDAEGTILSTDRDAALAITREQLEVAFESLLGEGLQVPPMYSALRHQGKRLHELARAGAEVERPPRPIHIHSLELRTFSPPRATFSVHCSKGTYVRSLVADIGDQLGCGAHLTALRRTRSGQFTLEDAMSPTAVTIDHARARLIDPAAALHHLPSLQIPAEKQRLIANGTRLPWAAIAPGMPEPTGICRLDTTGGKLLALVHVQDGKLDFDRVFSYALT